MTKPPTNYSPNTYKYYNAPYDAGDITEVDKSDDDAAKLWWDSWYRRQRRLEILAWWCRIGFVIAVLLGVGLIALLSSCVYYDGFGWQKSSYVHDNHPR